MSRCGTSQTHCCWFRGEPCKYVRKSENPDFVWECSLRAELGSWEAVYVDNRYQQDVQPKMEEIGCGDIGCGGWPPPNVVCGDCGEGR